VQYVASNAWPNRLSTLLQRMVAQIIKILSPIDARYGQAILQILPSVSCNLCRESGLLSGFVCRRSALEVEEVSPPRVHFRPLGTWDNGIGSIFCSHARIAPFYCNPKLARSTRTIVSCTQGGHRVLYRNQFQQADSLLYGNNTGSGGVLAEVRAWCARCQGAAE
jgi:hypothetical protein